MLSNLLESRPARSRRGSGTVASVAAHALLIALAVVATKEVAIADDSEGVRQIHLLPPLPPEPAPTPAPPAPRTPTRTSEPAPMTEPTLPPLPPVGPTISIDIPPPGAPLVVTDRFERSFRGGLPGDGAPVAQGGDAFLGTEETVERAVVPLRGNAPPRYPEAMRTAGVQGRVVVRFVVDTLGRVEPGSLVIVDATHDAFAAAVRDAVARLRFVPAEAYGRRARQLVEQPFDFKLQR